MAELSLEEITDTIVDVCNHTAFKSEGDMTIAMFIAHFIYNNQANLSPRSIASLYGISALILRRAVDTGEYDQVIHDFLQPNATRQ